MLGGPELRHDVRYLNSHATPEIGHSLGDTNTHPLGAGVDGGQDSSLSAVMNRHICSSLSKEQVARGHH